MSGITLPPKLPDAIAAARQHNREQSIHSLPVELLSSIFMLLIDLAEDRASEPISALKLVCTTWRDIFLSTPHLWARIARLDPPGYIRTALERSQDSPLDIFLMWQSWTCFDLILQHVSRWRRARIFVESERLLSDAECDVIFDAAMLEDIFLFGGYSDRSNLGIPDSRPPRLRYLELKNVGIAWKSRLLSDLRVLKLHHWNEALSTEQFHHILSHSPDLQELLLDFDDRCPINGTVTTGLSVVHLPLLLSIDVRLPIAMLAPFLSILSAPNVLVCDILSRCENMPVAAFNQHAERLQSSLAPYFANFVGIGNLEITLSAEKEVVIILNGSSDDDDDARRILVQIWSCPRQLSLGWLARALGDRAQQTAARVTVNGQPDDSHIEAAQEVFQGFSVKELFVYHLYPIDAANSFLTFIESMMSRLHSMEELSFRLMAIEGVGIERLLRIVRALAIGNEGSLDPPQQTHRQLKLLSLQYCTLSDGAHNLDQLEDAMAGGILEVQGTDPRKKAVSSARPPVVSGRSPNLDSDFDFE